MGVQYGKVRGVFSKMTVLSKEGKQLPTFGNVSLLYKFDAHLRKLRAKSENSKYLGNNLFISNPNLYKGASSKNQIVKDGNVVDFKAANEKDQIITNIFYEWF